MKYLLGIVIAALLLLGGAWAAYRAGLPVPLLGTQASTAAAPAQEPASAAADDGDHAAVVALGWIEPAGGVIEISGTPGDRIESVLVAEGNAVEADQPLVYLASREMVQLEIASLRSQIVEAEALSAAEKSLADARIIAAELEVEQADLQEMDRENLDRNAAMLEANLRLAKKDQERLDNLSDELVSAQERERQGLLVERAKAELAAARADAKKLERTLDFTRRAAAARLDAARAGKQQAVAEIPVESLRRQLEMAQARLRQSEIRAPGRGTVLKVFVEPGESVGRTPLLQMADLRRMAAVAEVYETDVKRIEPGGPAVVRSAAFRPPYDEQGLRGTVERIGRLISTPELKSLDPFARADRHVVPVRILLDEEGSRAAASLSNLQVDVEFPPADGSAR